MTHETVLANATIVLPDRVERGAIRIVGGEIADISAGAGVPAGAVDCEGDFVAPGLVELHTDNLERHIQPRPRVNWPHDAAILAHDAELAATGITTVFDAMRVGSIPGGKGRYMKYARGLASELLAMRAADALKISHFLHLRAEVCSETLVEEMDEFGPQDRVGLVSLMDHTPGQRQFRDMDKLETYVKGKLGLSDAEFTEHVAELRALRDANGERHEAAAVRAAARYGAVLASHDDTTPRTGGGLAPARYPAGRVFATTHDAAAACRAHGIAVMMGAPNLVRGGSHSGNVAAADLAQAGLIDILSSDYVPAALLMGAVQLGALWGDMARGIATVTTNPARAVGLDDRGAIAPGARADVIRFAMRGQVPAVRAVWSRGQRVA